MKDKQPVAGLGETTPRVLKILLVDDSVIIRRMIQKSLALSGLGEHEVVEAGDGSQALSCLRNRGLGFDLVLADIHMPKMTGTELVAAMAGDESMKRIPVVIISSDGNAAHHDELEALGVRAFLKKPFRPENLRDVVQPLLGREGTVQ